MARFCASVDASSSTARWVRMPNASSHASQSSASVMSAVVRPSTRTTPGVRQQRAVHQIDEHLGGGAIEAGDGHALAILDGELGDAQRTQRPVVLDDAGELERAHQRRSTTGWPRRAVEPGERLRGRPDLADAVDPAGVVAVEVGPAGHQQPAALGDRGVARHGLGVVVAVVHLDRVEPGRDPARDPLVALRRSGMRQRRDAAGA